MFETYREGLARQEVRGDAARAADSCLAGEVVGGLVPYDAAVLLAANRWHRGYFRQDGNVYWRWRDELSCQDYAVDGCWHVEVITRNGCQTYVAVQANENRGHAIVNELLDNQDFGIPPKTRRIFELDADAGSTEAGNVSIGCE